MLNLSDWLNEKADEARKRDADRYDENGFLKTRTFEELQLLDLDSYQAHLTIAERRILEANKDRLPRKQWLQLLEVD